MEDITDADYMQVKRVCKDLEIKNLGEYHVFYLKSDTLLLADIYKPQRKLFQNLLFRVSKISFSSRICMASIFNKDWSKIRIVNWYWYAINGWKRH